MASKNEDIRSERIQVALETALDGGDTYSFFDLVERASGSPGPRPNIDLAKALGARLAAEGKRGLALTQELLDHKNEYFVRVALMALAGRAAKPDDRTKALQTIHDRADEPRKSARDAVIDALTLVLVARGDEAVPKLSIFTDGFLHAFVAMEALTQRVVLDRLTSSEELFLRLDEAFDLADKSSRAAERAQGVRLLREGFPDQINRIALRFSETLDWLEKRLSEKRPETRTVLDLTMKALRKASLSDAEAARLRAIHQESAPIPRDPTRIVQHTRRRSRGR